MKVKTSKTGKTLKKAGYVRRGRHEDKYEFLRRISFDHIFPRHPKISVDDLVAELERITRQKVERCFILSQIIFPDSGIIIEGDVIWAPVADYKTARMIQKISRQELKSQGGQICRKELISRVKEKSERPTCYITNALFGKKTGKDGLSCRLRKGKAVVIL